MPRDKYVIFGWPRCGYAQRARDYAKQQGWDYEFVDTSRQVPEFLRALPTFGSGRGRWQSPHVFKYLGGASELSSGAAGGGSCTRAQCHQLLDGVCERK